MDECSEYSSICDAIIERKPLYVAITGGEPLLVFDKVKESILKLRKAGIVCSISTNGTLINEEIASFLEENSVDLVISLPSSNPEVCDFVCTSKNVVKKLENVWPLLKKHNIKTNINIVINKANLDSLYDTLAYVKKLGFIARVGLAQRPINASKDYLPYEIDRNDALKIIRTCIKAKHELDIDIDFSVCLPDCIFETQEQLETIAKGNCFAGTIAYAITTNGDVKACQCDTKVYGNILKDDFEGVYQKMQQWRCGDLIPNECKDCARLDDCQGGCRIEAYATTGSYKALPTFADVNNKNIVNATYQGEDLIDYSDCGLLLNKEALFLKDVECYRVSVGIVPTFLTIEFGEWLQKQSIIDLNKMCLELDLNKEEALLIINLLVKNNVLLVQK